MNDEVKWVKQAAGRYATANGLLIIGKQGREWNVAYRVVFGVGRGEWRTAATGFTSLRAAKIGATSMIGLILDRIEMDWAEALQEDMAWLTRRAREVGVDEDTIESIKLHAVKGDTIRIRSLLKIAIENRLYDLAATERAKDLRMDAQFQVTEALRAGYGMNELNVFLADLDDHVVANREAWVAAISQVWVEAVIQIYEGRHAQAEHNRS